MRITLAKIGNNKTIDFALDELEKYLKLIDADSVIDRRVYSDYDENVENVIWVGESESFSSRFPEVENPELDDAILIDIAQMSGIISGNNQRAVLIAVYRFLRELGCAWVRNTRDGEIIPSYSLIPVSMYICEAASYRHRAICIEGAVNFEHVRDMIDWIPKAGMNGYYIQFFIPGNFFERWYSHSSNPYLPPEPINAEDIEAMVYAIEEEIEKRGLLYHAIGHGWTSKPFGFDFSGWHTEDSSKIPADVKPLIAEIDGERKFYHDLPMATNLCYSNPVARGIVTDAIADYCISHPEVNYVHFWLADAVNCFCECDNCRDVLPADHYVMMLNEVDEKLTAANCDTKVVFLIYYDLLWAPKTEKLKNPNRFVLMFAPITRKYSQSFKDEIPKSDETAEFKRNKLIIPKNVSENISYLSKWFENSGAKDSFDFDYHLMWDHQNDAGYYLTAKTLFDDMQALEKIGLRGMVSCQLTRASFPTGLPMQMMADALWDKECDFEEKSDEYFLSAFGIDGLAVKEYMKKLSELFDPDYMRHAIEEVNPEMQKKLAQVQGLISEFEKVIESNLMCTENGNLRKSWEYLSYHAQIIKKLAHAMSCRARGADADEKRRLFVEVSDFVNKLEPKLHHVLDGYMYYYRLKWAIADLGLND